MTESTEEEEVAVLGMMLSKEFIPRGDAIEQIVKIKGTCSK